jgi:hypothetical protein
VKRAELVLFAGGRELRRVSVPRGISPGGTRIELGDTRIDALEFRPLAIEGKFRGRALAALAEIETIARIAGD